MEITSIYTDYRKTLVILLSTIIKGYTLTIIDFMPK